MGFQSPSKLVCADCQAVNYCTVVTGRQDIDRTVWLVALIYREEYRTSDGHREHNGLKFQ